MKIILLLECSIHEVTYLAGSELEIADFEGEFLISHHRAKKANEKRLKNAKNKMKKQIASGEDRPRNDQGEEHPGRQI